MLGAPDAEIWFDPLGHEIEVNAFKRGFEHDFACPVLDFELDELQPDRALAERYEAQRPGMDAQFARFRVVTFGEHDASPHVEGHAVGRHISRMLHKRTARQQNPAVQPVRSWNKPRYR